jgi:hypothetical protein
MMVNQLIVRIDFIIKELNYNMILLKPGIKVKFIIDPIYINIPSKCFVKGD